MADTTEIGPDGDVLLVCGEEPKTQRLRVCSTIMKKASPVFKAMLEGGRFKEGAELSAHGAVDIHLPDDDGENLALLCRVVHFKHEYVPEKLTIGRLTVLAQLADKYDMGKAVKPTAENFMRKLLRHREAAPGRCRLSVVQRCLANKPEAILPA